MHGPPAIYGRDRGLSFGYKWLAGLVSRVFPGATKYSAVDSPGDHNFGGTIDSVTQVCAFNN